MLAEVFHCGYLAKTCLAGERGVSVHCLIPLFERCVSGRRDRGLCRFRGYRVHRRGPPDGLPRWAMDGHTWRDTIARTGRWRILRPGAALLLRMSRLLVGCSNALARSAMDGHTSRIS